MSCSLFNQFQGKVSWRNPNLGHINETTLEKYIAPEGWLMCALEENIYEDAQDGNAPELWYMQLDIQTLQSEYGFQIWETNGRKAIQMQEKLRVFPIESVLQVVLKFETQRKDHLYYCLYRSTAFERSHAVTQQFRSERGWKTVESEYIMECKENIKWSVYTEWFSNNPYEKMS